MKIVDSMESIICLDCDNVESGDQPWYSFDFEDKTNLFCCKDCKSKNIRFARDIRYEKNTEEWIEDGYYDQLSKLEKKAEKKGHA
tara:strand:+ start:338 stop:592 length:255 start_codon:yes stop_codon:yes gene_type:complete